ncbi:hypothetical protein SPB21_02530 [Leptothoe sp. ISB3NOV94-8A]|nr:hypothetical protein Lepto7375DRAFT_7768 [Leptolyngbya sp. PCC 7375]
MPHQQLTLSKPQQLNCCPWARPHRDGASLGIVLAVPCPLPYGLKPWLDSQGYSVVAIAEDRGQWAALLTGDVGNLLLWLDRPQSQGSETAGNLLPW